MEFMNLINPVEFKIYLLVLVRVSIVLFMLPVFSTTMFPALCKAGLAMVISMLIYSVVPVDPSIFPRTVIGAGVLLLSEAMIGITLGLCVRTFFASIELAGQIIGFQMGFSMINVVDPQSGANISILEQIGFWVAILIFICLDGHHIMILALIESFKLVPPGSFVVHKILLTKVIKIGAEMFFLGIKIGAPVIAALLFTSGAFGLMAKFSPEMNVMIVAFPLKIFVGLVLFGLSLQITIFVVENYVGNFKGLLMSLLYFAGGGG